MVMAASTAIRLMVILLVPSGQLPAVGRFVRTERGVVSMTTTIAARTSRAREPGEA